MAFGKSLILREIKPTPEAIPPSFYEKYCFRGLCVTGISDRGTRRNKQFRRGKYANEPVVAAEPPVTSEEVVQVKKVSRAEAATVPENAVITINTPEE